MQMEDLGHKMGEDMPEVATKSSEDDWKNKIYYPNLCLNSKDLPGIEDLDVGQTIMMTFKAKVTSKSVRDTEQSGANAHLDFDLLQGAIKVMKVEPKKKNEKEADEEELPSKRGDFMDDMMDEEDE